MLLKLFILLFFFIFKALISAILSICRKTVGIYMPFACTGPLKYLIKLIMEENDHCAVLHCIFLISGDAHTIFFSCWNTSQKWLQPFLNSKCRVKREAQISRLETFNWHASLPTVFRSVLLRTVLILVLRGGPFFFTRYRPAVAK